MFASVDRCLVLNFINDNQEDRYHELNQNCLNIYLRFLLLNGSFCFFMYIFGYMELLTYIVNVFPKSIFSSPVQSTRRAIVVTSFVRVH